MKPGQPFVDLPALAIHLRDELENKKTILLYAYNGTGKTRLSMKFKDFGRRGDTCDTLYFNAFTEDLFHWDNDLDGDSDRRLTLNAHSRFFAGLTELEMDKGYFRKILHNFLNRYPFNPELFPVPPEELPA
jgi:hypothetical protein